MKEIPITRGLVTLVDEEDYDTLMQWKWHAAPDGPRCYVLRNVRLNGRRTSLSMHRFLMGTDASVHVDHIDNNGLNNQRSNLRVATFTQNQANKRKRSGCSSQYKGVSRYPRGSLWQASFYGQGFTQYLGLYTTEEEAARAYDRAARAKFGVYARLNLPEGDPDEDEDTEGE